MNKDMLFLQNPVSPQEEMRELFQIGATIFAVIVLVGFFIIAVVLIKKATKKKNDKEQNNKQEQ